MARSVFYSFHYKPDVTRVAKIRNIGAIEGNKPAKDNDWETVTGGGDAAIKKWITSQLKGRSCTLVLAGSETAGRKWINHEIIQSWIEGMGVAVIYVHGISDIKGNTTAKGNNPLDSIKYGDSGKKLSDIAKAYTPTGIDSKAKYDWISKNVEAIIEEAIKIRKEN